MWCCRLHMETQTYVIASGQQNNMKAFACLPASSKTRLPKQDHLESSVCSCQTWTLTVFLRQNFINNGYRACTLLWKRFTIFPRNLSFQSSYLRWKFIDLFSSAVSGVEIKNLQRSERLTFSISQLHRLISHSQLLSACACTSTWACSQAIWQRDWRWPCFDTDLPLLSCKCTYNHGQKSWDKFALLVPLGTRQTWIKLHLTNLAPHTPHTMLKTTSCNFFWFSTLYWVGRGKSNTFLKGKQCFFKLQW